MQNLLQRTSPLSLLSFLAIVIGLAIGFLGASFPMIGVESQTLGYLLFGLGVLLVAIGVLVTVARIALWVGPKFKRVRLRSPFTLAPAADGSPETEPEDPLPQSEPEQAPVGNENERFGKPTVVLGTDVRPLVGDEELRKKTYERRSFWMGEFARKNAPSGETQAVLRDRRFYDCDIYGPVLFGPLDPDEIERTFVDCEWLESEEAVSWLPVDDRREYVGAVRLEDCRFEGCRISRVGVLRTR